MLIEVALLQRFVLLLGHPVYSLTVTLFSLLLGTGIGSLMSRHVTDAGVAPNRRDRLPGDRRRRRRSWAPSLPPSITLAIGWPLPLRSPRRCC